MPGRSDRARHRSEESPTFLSQHLEHLGSYGNYKYPYELLKCIFPDFKKIYIPSFSSAFIYLVLGEA